MPRDTPRPPPSSCAISSRRPRWWAPRAPPPCPEARPGGDKINRMIKLAMLLLSLAVMACAAELPSKKYLDLAAIKKLVSGAEAEAQKRNVHVTICIVDESGNLLFLQKADGIGLNTIQFAQRKARHAAIYRRPSATAQEQLKGGNMAVL